jgi:hypothetical protein
MQTPAYVRVINSQVLPRDILLDKIDRTSGQFETDLTYAQTPKQAVYVPYVNPIDPTVPGYLDLVPSDEVRLQSQLPHGVITKLAAKGYVSFFTHAGGLSAGPSITGAVHNTPVGDTTISGPASGATFLSLTPDHTYVILTNLSGAKQTIKDTAITGGGGTIAAASIVLPNTLVTGGPVVAGWMVQVQSNSKLSNVFTVT